MHGRRRVDFVPAVPPQHQHGHRHRRRHCRARRKVGARGALAHGRVARLPHAGWWTHCLCLRNATHQCDSGPDARAAGHPSRQKRKRRRKGDLSHRAAQCTRRTSGAFLGESIEALLRRLHQAAGSRLPRLIARRRDHLSVRQRVPTPPPSSQGHTVLAHRRSWRQPVFSRLERVRGVVEEPAPHARDVGANETAHAP